jgi:quinol-cytochrome oxidoreductase complex cytochrome b subunit
MAENVQHHEGDTIPFYPDHVLTEAKVTAAILLIAGLVGALALFFPVGIGQPADPMVTPAHAKPEWYFLALYQMLKLVPETIGVLIPIIGLAVFLIWPFLDGKINTPRAQRIRLIGSAVFLVIFVALTIWGELS